MLDYPKISVRECMFLWLVNLLADEWVDILSYKVEVTWAVLFLGGPFLALGKRQQVKGFTDIHNTFNLKDMQYSSPLDMGAYMHPWIHFVPWNLTMTL